MIARHVPPSSRRRSRSGENATAGCYGTDGEKQRAHQLNRTAKLHSEIRRAANHRSTIAWPAEMDGVMKNDIQSPSITIPPSLHYFFIIFILKLLLNIPIYITHVTDNNDSKILYRIGEKRSLIKFTPFSLFLSEFSTLRHVFPYKSSTGHPGSKSALGH